MYRILIADDSMFARESLKEILISEGYEVVGEAKNGSEAVSMFKALRPDLVTMDITMPELNGIEALKQIMTEDQNANVIMLTAVGRPDTTIEALNHGAKNYITKPFDRDGVVKAVEHVISNI